MNARGKLLLVFFAGVELAKLTVPGYAAPPRTVTVAGEDLVLNGMGTREALTSELYTVALYLPPAAPASVDRIRDPAVPKAFYVEVDYGGSSTPDGVSEDWREELLPVAPDEPAADDLRDTLHSLGEGDVVHIAYTPEAGTAVDLNGETVFWDHGHELIAAVVDLWLGPDAVSDDVRRGLLYGGT